MTHFNSIQVHHHASFGVERFADDQMTRWSMTVGCLVDPSSPAVRYGNGAVMKRPILGCGMLLGGECPTLIISDLHCPYHHPDAFEFLYQLDRQFKFQRVLNVGDLIDHHAGSFHTSEPDALGPEEEYRAARDAALDLQSLFPEMVITQGNHDKIPMRKLKECGLPTSVLSNYNKMYELEDSWYWTDKYRFDSMGGYPVTHPMVLNKRGRWDKDILTM
jgi:hypothetical protein